LSQIEISPSTDSQGTDPKLSNTNESGTCSNSASFDVESNIFLYRDSYFHQTANILGTMISSLICIAAIVVLYLVPDMRKRLAIVSLFTAVFSIALSLATAATRAEIFVATAA
jgi:hypothetical protein